MHDSTPPEDPLSDMLSITGWIGEHPRSHHDVSHLLLFSTDLDPDSPAKLQQIAHAWGLGTVAGDPRRVSAVKVLIHDRLLQVPGMTLPLPTSPEWITVARMQGYVVLTLTTTPLPAVDMDTVDTHLRHAPAGSLWYCRAKVVDRP